MQSDPPDEKPRSKNLSPRQKQILEALALGKTRKQIAAELGISPNTVRSYLYIAYDRMGVRNAPEAVTKMAVMDGA